MPQEVNLSYDLQDYAALAGALKEDIQDSLQLYISSKKSQFSRRIYARTLFSQIEAWVYNLKTLILESELILEAPPTPLELTALREETWGGVSDAGQPQVRADRFIPLAANIRFACQTAARCFGVSYSIAAGEAGWKAFREALEIRNRLTHPRSSADLAVSDTEVETIHKAHEWFASTSTELYKAIVDHLTGRDREAIPR